MHNHPFWSLESKYPKLALTPSRFHSSRTRTRCDRYHGPREFCLLASRGSRNINFCGIAYHLVRGFSTCFHSYQKCCLSTRSKELLTDCFLFAFQLPVRRWIQTIGKAADMLRNGERACVALSHLLVLSQVRGDIIPIVES